MALSDLMTHPLVRFVIPGRFRRTHPVVPVVRLTGAIGAGAPFMQGLTVTGAGASLERAFAVRDAAAVAIVVNSPGGSAVQSHLLYKRIRALAVEHKRHVIAVVEDVAASGGYMIACAADEIFCDGSSIVGSIGVISAGFGFAKAIDKLGVERRVVASGRNKGMLDPFLPERPDDVERLQALQTDVHRQFVALVEARRAGKLQPDGMDLFTGEFWAGTRAVELGLVDGIGDLRSVLRERYGDKVRIRLVGTDRSWFLRRSPSIAAAAAGLPGAALAAAQERALWARFGL
jgi:signal peptide peptidase SppA